MIAKQPTPPRLAHWATTDNLIDAGTTTAAATGVLFVTVAGIVLSYDALWDLAWAAGSINPGLTWLWPLTLDALAIVASLNVLWAEIRGERDRYAWGLVIAFTLLSVLFNATHASLEQLLALHPFAPLVVSALVGILPPVAAAFALHLMVRLLRRVLERVTVIAGIADLDRARAEASAEHERLSAEIESLAGKRDQVKVELQALRKEKRQRSYAGIGDETRERALEILRDAPQITGAELGRQLGRSDSTGRKLRRELLPVVNNNGAGGGES